MTLMDAPVETNPQLSLSESGLHELENRVNALEEAVGRLEDTQALEERIVARVTDRLPQVKVSADHDTGILEERVLARLADRMPAAPVPPQSDGAFRRDDTAPSTSWGGGWASWLFIDMFREAKLLVQMVFDRRYRMAWTTRVVAIILLPAIILAHWWLPLLFFWFPLMWFAWTQELCINLVNLLLAFALYKALSREARRYAERVRH